MISYRKHITYMTNTRQTNTFSQPTYQQSVKISQHIQQNSRAQSQMNTIQPIN